MKFYFFFQAKHISIVYFINHDLPVLFSQVYLVSHTTTLGRTQKNYDNLVTTCCLRPSVFASVKLLIENFLT